MEFLVTSIFITFSLLKFIFGFLFLKTRDHLRCYLLFGLIDYSGLLIDIKMSFFFSLLSLLITFFSLETNYMTSES